MPKSRNVEYLVIIDAPHFYAGVVVKNGWIIKTAPILHYAKGKTLTWLSAYSAKRKWKVIAQSLSDQS